MSVQLRGMSRADIARWVVLLAAIEEVEHTGEYVDSADLEEAFDDPAHDPAKDMVGAFDGEDLVGFFQVTPRPVVEDYFKVHVGGGVAPKRRGEGIGSRLVEAMLVRADELHAVHGPGAPMRVAAYGLSDNIDQADLLTSAGFVPDRWSFTMRAQLSAVGDAAPTPPGIAIQPWSEAIDAQLLDAHIEAFRDHPNSVPMSQQEWQHWVTGSRSFRPEVTFVATSLDDPATVLSYLQTAEFEAYQAATGRREAYVAKVGTRRAHRGKGLASVLLDHALAAYRHAGFDEACLDVDSDNPTGALGIYTRAGFTVETRFTNYIR